MHHSHIAWAAGLLEGEACFDIRKSQSVKRDPNNMHVRVIVEMKDKDVLGRLQKMFGGTLTEVRCKSKQRENWSTYYKWLLTKREDVQLCLCVIKPYMSQRRTERINEILKFLNRKLNEGKSN